MVRLFVVLSVAVLLAAADLVWKAIEPTPEWALHQRSAGWLGLSLATFLAMLAVVRIPSRWVPLAAGLLAGGVLGNMLSAAWNDLSVPNPIVVGGETGVIAFNLADVWALVGIVGLTSAIGAWLIRNRELLPAPSEVRTRLARKGRPRG
jgi:hypothetical protein